MLMIPPFLSSLEMCRCSTAIRFGSIFRNRRFVIAVLALLRYAPIRLRGNIAETLIRRGFRPVSQPIRWPNTGNPCPVIGSPYRIGSFPIRNSRYGCGPEPQYALTWRQAGFRQREGPRGAVEISGC